MRKSLRKISAAVAGCALAMALTVSAVPNAADAATKPQCTKAGLKAGKAAFDPDGTYHAYFGFQQQTTWIFRDQWFSPTLGLEGTELAEMYRKGEIDFMSEDEYVNTVCDFLEYLPPQTTIHRLAGNGLRTELVAPRWIGKKLDCLNKIDREFLRRDTRQGSRFESL